MTEQWQLIPFYPDYQVSSEGRVRSMRNRSTWRIMKGSLNRDGYPLVTLTNASGSKKRLVHRLVAYVFLGPRPSGLFICHRNDVKTDNRVANLYYGTPKQNAEDRLRNEKIRAALPPPKLSRKKPIEPHILEAVRAELATGSQSRMHKYQWRRMLADRLQVKEFHILCAEKQLALSLR